MSQLNYISFLKGKILLGLVLSLFFNVTLLTGCSQNPISSSSQKQVIGKRKDSRRREVCKESPSIWTVNICQPHSFCYVTEQIDLWLPKNKRSGQMNDRVVIQNTVSQLVVIEPWPASKDTLVWPLDKMPIQSGVTYSISVKKGPDYPPKEIVLHQLPADLSVEEQIVEMRQKGCTQQAEQLSGQNKGLADR